MGALGRHTPTHRRWRQSTASTKQGTFAEEPVTNWLATHPGLVLASRGIKALDGVSLFKLILKRRPLLSVYHKIHSSSGRGKRVRERERGRQKGRD